MMTCRLGSENFDPLPHQITSGLSPAAKQRLLMKLKQWPVSSFNVGSIMLRGETMAWPLMFPRLELLTIVLPVPLHKPADALFNAGGRLEAYIIHQVIHIG